MWCSICISKYCSQFRNDFDSTIYFAVAYGNATSLKYISQFKNYKNAGLRRFLCTLIIILKVTMFKNSSKNKKEKIIRILLYFPQLLFYSLLNSPTVGVIFLCRTARRKSIFCGENFICSILQSIEFIIMA